MVQQQVELPVDLGVVLPNLPDLGVKQFPRRQIGLPVLLHLPVLTHQDQRTLIELHDRKDQVQAEPGKRIEPAASAHPRRDEERRDEDKTPRSAKLGDGISRPLTAR